VASGGPVVLAPPVGDVGSEEEGDFQRSTQGLGPYLFPGPTWPDMINPRTYGAGR
jgi:hypothetical protein